MIYEKECIRVIVTTVMIEVLVRSMFRLTIGKKSESEDREYRSVGDLYILKWSLREKEIELMVVMVVRKV